MKTLFMKATALAALSFISGSLIVRSKEEPLCNLSEYTIPSDKCFDAFLANLKSLDAIIFVPENKLVEAKRLGLMPLETPEANKANINFVKAYEFYGQILPPTEATDECSKSVLLNFEKLELVVFVKNDKQGNLGNLNLLKLDKHMDLTKHTGLHKVLKYENSGSQITFKFDELKGVKYTPMLKM
jgi:hypothetical protein